ncbi:unnamed protein product [Citrullus colocynthis]|uniref:Uncharacterized protein n=1 Tax=Citrullus colocynthis TaxID=252529 RepID=A0ABP0YRM4_9ROSI
MLSAKLTDLPTDLSAAILFRIEIGYHVPDIAPPSLGTTEEAPSVDFVASSFGRCLMHSLSEELCLLDDVIDCAFDWKHEVIVLLNLMR